MAESCPKGQVYNQEVGKCVKKKSKLDTMKSKIKSKLDTTKEAEQYKKNLSHWSSDKALSKRYVREHTLIQAVQGAGIGHSVAGISGKYKKQGKYALGGAIVGGISGYVSARKKMKEERKKRKNKK